MEKLAKDSNCIGLITGESVSITLRITYDLI